MQTFGIENDDFPFLTELNETEGIIKETQRAVGSTFFFFFIFW